MSDKDPVIAVVGPTAAGKSDLALELALRFGGEIVGCDALQVYKDMDVGTAKVPPAARRGVPHHLVDVREPQEEFSAGDYQRLARAAIREILLRGNLPLVAGGTGFYLRALLEGLFEGPERSAPLRRRMKGIIARKGPEVLHRALARVDPESAARIGARDAGRIIRAYELYLSSGRTMTWWQARPKNAFPGIRWLKIGIDLPREQLYARIDRRVERMFASGLLEEVRALLDRCPPSCQAFQAIGYRQAAEVLGGRMELGRAIESTQQESRRYAKRQLSWFRADREILWLDGGGGEGELAARAAEEVSRFLREG